MKLSKFQLIKTFNQRATSTVQFNNWQFVSANITNKNNAEEDERAPGDRAVGYAAQTEGGAFEGGAHVEEGKLEQGGDAAAEEERGSLLQGSQFSTM